MIKQIFSSKLMMNALKVSLIGGLIISSLIITYLYWAFEVDLNKKIESDKATVSKYLAETLAAPLQFENISDIRKILNPFLQTSLDWAVVYNSNNMPIFTSGLVPDRSEIEESSTEKTTSLKFKIEVPVKSNTLIIGKVIGAMRVEDLNNDKRSFIIRIIFLSFALILFSGFVLFYILGLILSRVMSLSEFITKYPNVQDKHFVKKETKTADEITAIYTEFVKAFRKEENLLIALGEKSKNEAIGLQSAQIAHDIRSPLSALTMLTGSLSEISEEKRILVRNAINRITDIANNLLDKSKKQKLELGSNNEEPVLEITLLAALVESIVSEKRIQFRAYANVNIEANLQESYGLFARINATELKRVLSNLLNNAVEAFDSTGGNIDVLIYSVGCSANVIVKDNGKGIPKHILDKLGQHGVSHGKEGTQSGSGLGVYHAKKTIESFGGTFKIDSQDGIGTTITLSLTKEKAPDWFVEKLILNENQIIVATDDDNSVLEIWRQRLSYLQNEKGLKLITCSSGACLRDWISNAKQEAEDAIFLMDYELIGQKETGLDLVEELKISKRAILVSSRYEEKGVRDRCEKMGVKLIPKAMAALVPITLEPPKIKNELLGAKQPGIALIYEETKISDRFVEMGINVIPKEMAPIVPVVDYCEEKKLDGVVIDNDPLIEMVWNFAAKESGRSIMVFADENAFMAKKSFIPTSTPIYVDVSLSDGIRGQDVARRINTLGFTEIHLATGYQAETIERPEFIKSVVGKDFPFA